ncbi:MAG TPA: DUF4349 domain-containing protein [Anaerolineaceae bacterium]|nr:DUF4349 domain-containing protein [Anaerolineaceae bacterium]
MRTKIVVAIIILSMVLSGCSAAAKTADNFAGEIGFAPAPAAMPMEDSMAEEFGYDSSYDAASSTSDIQVEEMQRMVIRNADLSIVVEDPIVASNSIGRMAERMGGYIVSSNSWKTRNFRDIEVPEANIQIRVPSELLNQALEEIKSLLTNRDIDLLSENVSGQDVTKEYTDLNSRLRNLEDAEEQLRKILDEAYKTEDVLNVFNQLTYYREQIEITKGQIKYYEESAALSSISVRIQAQEAVNPITIAGWKPSVTISKALQQLVNAFQVIVDGAIYLVLLIIPIIIVILLPFYLLFLLIRALVRKNKKKKQEIKEINKE